MYLLLILSVIFPQTTLGITPIKFPDISKAENKKAVETTKEKPGKFLDKIKGPRVYPDFLDSATKGIGYKFNSGSDYLDIRLSGYPAADGLTLGNKRIYSVTDNINVVYTESYRKVKEDIVLFKKPQNSRFSFSLSKSNLSLKK